MDATAATEVLAALDALRACDLEPERVHTERVRYRLWDRADNHLRVPRLRFESD